MRPLLPILLLCAPPAFAEGGLTGAAFLQRQLGGRAGGMGSAYAAVGGAPGSHEYNPAGIWKPAYPEVSGSYLRGFGDDYYGSLYGRFAFDEVALLAGAHYYDGGQIRFRPAGGGPEQVFRAARDVAAMAGAAAPVPFAPDFTAGLIYKWAQQRLATGPTARSHLVDIGLQWKFPWRTLRLGAALQNVGGPFTFESDGAPAPTTWRAGLAYSWETFSVYRWLQDLSDLRSVRVVGTFDVAKTRFERLSPRVGVDMRLEMPFLGFASLRGGWMFRRDSEDFTFGMGFEEGAYTLDYALGNGADLRMKHQVTFGYKFGTRDPDFDY